MHIHIQDRSACCCFFVPSRTRVPVSTPNPSHDSSEFSDLEDTPLGPRAFPPALSVSRSSPFRIDFLEKVISASHAVLDRRFAWACSSGSGTVLNYRASKIIADSDSMIRRRARDNGEGRCAEARRAIAALSASPCTDPIVLGRCLRIDRALAASIFGAGLGCVRSGETSGSDKG